MHIIIYIVSGLHLLYHHSYERFRSFFNGMSKVNVFIPCIMHSFFGFHFYHCITISWILNVLVLDHASIVINAKSIAPIFLFHDHSKYIDLIEPIIINSNYVLIEKIFYFNSNNH